MSDQKLDILVKKQNACSTRKDKHADKSPEGKTALHNSLIKLRLYIDISLMQRVEHSPHREDLPHHRRIVKTEMKADVIVSRRYFSEDTHQLTLAVRKCTLCAVKLQHSNVIFYVILYPNYCITNFMDCERYIFEKIDKIN